MVPDNGSNSTMYTYAFCKTPTEPLALPRGISGTVQLISHGQVSALVEPALNLELMQIEDDQLLRAVLSHDQILQLLFQQITLLPLRFGTQFASPEALQKHLATHQTDYLAKLEYLDGKAEYLLKLVPNPLPEATIPEELRGRDYFLAKKQQIQIQQEQQQQQGEALQTLVRTIAQAYPNPILGAPQEDGQRIYLLVSRREEAELVDRLQRWQEQCASWQLHLGESLPPHHFV